METKVVFHGSDVEKACSYYGLKKEDVVNFGANVNPLGISKKVTEELAQNLDVLSSYPDREYTALRETIAGYCGISPDMIIPGNGSSELIALLIEARKPEKTLVLGPTYSEYSRELAFSGSSWDTYHLKEENDFIIDQKELFAQLEKGYDFLILCNPNNPTSSAVTSGEMREILAFCKARDIFVMIDETYVEFAPEIGAITAIPLTKEFENLMVLRGVSKFYAAPGLRLGYGITGNAEFLKKMKEQQIPWSLNSVGAFVGERMFKDTEYFQKTRELILSERDRMYKEISSMNAYKAYPPSANFILVKLLKEGLTSADMFDACMKKGLMIRDCSSFQSLEGEFIRFCIMMPEDNTRLLEVMREISDY